jgi:CMP-N-acetylneuraminic acid synthetase
MAVIPARGGSKGIPRKNVREFLGRPLIAWTIEVAQASGIFTRVIVSTEDSEIAEVARACGAEVPFRRPVELASAAALTAPVVRHAVEWLRDQESWVPAYVMVLEPTSPARRAFHVREAAAVIAESGADSLASVSLLPQHYHPQKVLRRHPDGTITGIDGTWIRDMIHRRQDLPEYYGFDSLIFACRTPVLLSDPPTLWGVRVVGYVVEPRYGLDLDRPEDWAPSEVRMREILEEEKER